MRWTLLLCGLIAAAALCRSQEAASPAAFTPGAYPLKLTLGDLTPEWSKIIIPTSMNQGMAPMMEHGGPMALLLNENACYAKGQTVVLGGRTYLVVYGTEKIIPHNEEEARALFAAWSPQTPLLPSLISLNEVRNIIYAGRFDLKREIRASARRQLMLRQGKGEGGNEATLIANLNAMREAIAQFKLDTGAYPATLADLVLPLEQAPTRGIDANGKPLPIKPGAYAGPYLDPRGGVPEAPGIPLDPYIDLSLEQPDPALVITHWRYVDGAVSVPEFLFGIFTSNGKMLGEL